MKEKIDQSFRAAAATLGRHSGFASSYRPIPGDPRTVELVERARGLPDYGWAKHAWVLFADGFALLIGSFIISIMYAHKMRGIAGMGEESWGVEWIAAIIAIVIAVAVLGNMLRERFIKERLVLKKTLDAVEFFSHDCLKLSHILGFEEGTAKDIIDKRFLDLALEIVTIEMATSDTMHWIPGVSKLHMLRNQLREEHATAKKFDLGKGLRGYFDRAKVKWTNLAQKGMVRTDYCI